MGTAEFYSVVESLPEVADSLVVHLEDPDGGSGELWLFVVRAPGGPVAPDATRARPDGPPAQETLEARIKSLLRAELSPRHVPDHVVMVPAVPRTLSGKKLEVPVKRILSGADPGQVVAIGSVADPASLSPFIEIGRRRASAPQRSRAPSSLPGGNRDRA